MLNKIVQKEPERVERIKLEESLSVSERQGILPENKSSRVYQSQKNGAA